MSKKKYACIIISIILLFVMAFSFMFVSVILNSKNYGDFWFPKLFVIVPLTIILIIFSIYFIYRKKLKIYENSKHDRRIIHANIYFKCENIGNKPYKKIVASLYKNGFKGTIGEDAYFKKKYQEEIVVVMNILTFFYL